MAVPTVDELTASVVDAATLAFRKLFATGETFYYCVLITTGEALPPCIAAWSHESLARSDQPELDRWHYAAQSQLSTGKPWLWLTGNRDALLRFAAAFVRAAAAPIPDDECRAEPTILEHLQINDTKTDYTLGAVQRIDEFPENPDVIAERKRNAWRNDRGALLGCGVVGFMLLSILISAIAFWWHVITGTPLR